MTTTFRLCDSKGHILLPTGAWRVIDGHSIALEVRVEGTSYMYWAHEDNIMQVFENLPE